MQQEERRLNCERHPDSELSVIYIGDNPTIKSRFLCIECVLQGGEQYKKLSQLIKIKDVNINKIFKFFTNPGMQCRKSISSDIENHIQDINKCIDQLVIFFQKFYESIQTHLEQLKQNVKSLKILSATINYEIEKQSNFKELRQVYQKIKTMDSFQGTQEFKKIQEDVNAFCTNFNKFYNEVVILIKSRQEQSLMDYKQSLINIQKDLSQMSSINIYTNYKINVFNRENSLVLQHICKGNFKYDLLYQGTRDGLTTANYWQKCDQQSNLLTIITLKNGNIFGGYSPCQLVKKDSGYYVVDDTNSSFIFQQNQQEIYKLKNKDKAIYCHQNYGPIFGGGHDFWVLSDFKTVRSNIGHSYDITGYNVSNNKTHLIGEKDTEIMECKVYKIISFL